jgi:hypothetical protein
MEAVGGKHRARAIVWVLKQRFAFVLCSESRAVQVEFGSSGRLRLSPIGAHSCIGKC